MDKVSYVLPMMVTIQAEDPKEVMRRLNIALRDCVKDACLDLMLLCGLSIEVEWNIYQKTSLEDEEDK